MARRTKIAACLFTALFAVLLARDARAAETAVDLELVLIADASRSIDENEAKLQRQGTADAFRSREIINAIKAGTLGKIAVAYADFSSRNFNTLVVNWRLIGDEKSSLSFAGALLAAPPSYGQHTSISDGLEYAAALLATNNYNGARKVIDVSGDGANNYGRRVDDVRNDLVARGLIINALPIISPEDQFSYQYVPDLDRYFAACVIGGPGAFVMKAQGFVDFARAIRNKLFREVAYMPSATRRANNTYTDNRLLIRVQASPRRAPLQRAAPRYPAYPQGCDIGERMRRGYGGFGGLDSFDPPPIVNPGQRQR